MSFPILLQGEFQIITELTVKTVFLMFILHLPICFDTTTPTSQPSHHEVYSSLYHSKPNRA